jgi:hypothetical protein
MNGLLVVDLGFQEIRFFEEPRVNAILAVD